ncbi:MAG: carboxyl transferase domain-containing protein [Pseudomonadota bacterium]
MKLVAESAGVVSAVSVQAGETVDAGTVLIATELMKMLTEVTAPAAARILEVHVAVGDTIETGTVLATLEAVEAPAQGGDGQTQQIPSPLLEDLTARRAALSDAGRSARVARRHASGGRTARENVDDLLDKDSFNEIGGHALAAQHSTHTLDALIERSANDGVITGTGTVDGVPVAVLVADYTVMAGTQGFFHHKKVDRLLDIAKRNSLPLILYPEGGGGRPNDVDAHPVSVAQLEVTSFHAIAALPEHVPVIAVVHGYCFAGSAAFAAIADVIIATEAACIGMGGPAMIEGGGLGVFAPEEVGPAATHFAKGSVDCVVKDEAAATELCKTMLGLLADPFGSLPDTFPAQRMLDTLIPDNRRAVFEPRDVVHAVFDLGTVVETKRGFGAALVTGLARLNGRAVGFLASDCRTLGGAIDGDAAEKAAGLFDLCHERGLPIISFVDTPGFMVGPAAEETGQIKPIGRFFKAGARFGPPLLTVILRRAYGLGAMAMAGGGLHASDLTISWPTGAFGAMGLEGAVRLGFREQLAACEDEGSRNALFHDLVDGMAERGKALNAASYFEIDDVIMPSETRARLINALEVL